MIEVADLAVRAGTFSVSGISFAIPTGHYGVLMGRTATGKTTILETICGLKHAVAGTIMLNGREITHLKAANRGIGYVPQDGALFSTMTIRQHLAFALVVRKWSETDIDKRVCELAEMLDITPLLNRKPAGLSGGEGQRVALGRALAVHPGILCLDEPLSSLDEDTRGDMHALLKRINRQTGVTVLHVTHSPSEARALADRLLRIADGTMYDASDELPTDR